jgi:hypothetical protein
MTHPGHFRGQLAGVVLSGGNATAEQLAKWLAL